MVSILKQKSAAVHAAATQMLETTCQAVETAARLRRLKNRAAWSGWRIVDCGLNQFAMVKSDNEADRYPIRGTIDLATVERFIETRERKEILW
jgi:hypothetical protein